MKRHPDLGLPEMHFSHLRNVSGEIVLRHVESLDPDKQQEMRAYFRERNLYLVVRSREELLRGALGVYPKAIRRLCADAPIYRYSAIGGGGFWPDRNEIWLAAGVETYESLGQVYNSSRHELFHYVNWNHPIYKADLDRGFPKMMEAIEKSRPEVSHHPGYVAFLRRFLQQGDHANPVEYFADIPTNMFNEIGTIPSPLAHYFGPLVYEIPTPEDMFQPSPVSLPPYEGERLRWFQELLNPDQ